MISEQTKEYFELGKRNDVREHAATNATMHSCVLREVRFLTSPTLEVIISHLLGASE